MNAAVVFVLLAVLGQTNGIFWFLRHHHGRHNKGPQKVEVPVGKNIARGGTVTQSSTSHNGRPERAIDGNCANDWSKNSCTHTGLDKKPWWRLDLLKTYKITTVTITNRKDCCDKRLIGAQILIGNSLNDNGNGNPRCAVFRSQRPGATKTFHCKGMKGRYVNIVLPRKDYLTLCEVKVTGIESDDPTDDACD